MERLRAVPLYRLIEASDVYYCPKCEEPPSGHGNGEPWCTPCACHCIRDEATERQTEAIRGALIATLTAGTDETAAGGAMGEGAGSCSKCGRVECLPVCRECAAELLLTGEEGGQQ